MFPAVVASQAHFLRGQGTREETLWIRLREGVLRLWRAVSLKKFVCDDFKKIIQWNLNITNLYITKSSA